MTVLCAPLHKPIFKTAQEARSALARDGILGAVYWHPKIVFVETLSGTGTFSREEWERSKPEDRKS
jgi:hypothetical protein